MDKLEKVEKLRERANISYEAAKAALEENNWDLLDAMVALEKAGLAKAPEQEQYSTSYDQQKEYIPVKKKVEEQQKKKRRLGSSVGEVIRSIIRICRDNSLVVTRHDHEILRLPLLIAIAVAIITWSFIIPVMLVSLLFDCRYSFEGPDGLDNANAFMDSVSDAAENLKEGYNNARSRNKAAEGSDHAETVDHAENVDHAETVDHAEASGNTGASNNGELFSDTENNNDAKNDTPDGNSNDAMYSDEAAESSNY